MRNSEIIDTEKRLTTLVENINVLTPQDPPGFRSDDNKKRILSKVVLSVLWAYTPISQMITAKFTFNRFVTAVIR